MSNRYWLGLGPITREEERRATRHFEKLGKSVDRKSQQFRNFVARMRKRREVNRYLKGKEAAAADPSAPWQIIYGERVVGGAMTFIHSSGPNANDPDKWLHVIVTLACHEIQAIKAVYFDGYEVPWGTDLTTRPTGQVSATGIFAGLVIMQINYGTDGQLALSVPVADTTGHNPVGAKWTSNHRQRGHAHVYLRLTNNEKVFKNGTPELTFLVAGKRDITDPRTSTAAPAASNAALVLYDYLINSRFGFGLSASDFNSTRLNQAITDCEDLIPLAGGGNDLRYLINPLITSDEAPGAVVEQALASMAGHLTYTEGKWSVWAGKERTPVMTITEDMILSDIRLLTKTPRIDNFNTVRATYVSTTNDNEEVDAPEIKNTAYVTEDSGQVVAEDLTYGYVTSDTLVQRLMKIELNESRQGRFIEFTARLAAYQVEPGEWFNLDFSRFGWTGESFRLVRSSLQAEESPDGPPMWTVRLTAKVVESTIFDWSISDEQSADVYPDTNLPNPFVVQPPSGVTVASGTQHLYLRADGTVFTRLFVSWTAAPDSFVANGGYYEIQYLAAEIMLDWQAVTDVPGTVTSAYVLDVLEDIGYLVRVRAVNALGARSDWATSDSHVVVGKSTPPSAVTGLTATVDSNGVRLSWPPVPDADVREYEVRYATPAQTWAQAAANGVVRVRSTDYTYPLFKAGSWRYFVRAIDTSGNYSLSDAVADLTVTAPTAPQSLTATQLDSTVVLDWEAPALSTFSIAYYQVYRQAEGATALVGTVTGTFTTLVEIAGGSVTYIVVAVDVADNQGPSASVTKTIYAPPEYVFRDSDTLALSGATLANAVYIPEVVTVQAAADTAKTWEQHFTTTGVTSIQGFLDLGYTFWLEPSASGTGTISVTTLGPSVWLPFSAAETWEQHFTLNGFDQVQDFITAGYTNWLTPTTGAASTFEQFFASYGAGTFQELYDNGGLTLGATPGAPVAVVTLDYDMGETLPQSILTVDYQLVSQGFRPTPQLFWRATTSDPWTAGPVGRLRVTPNSYRYWRLVVTGQAKGPTDWALVSNVNYDIDVREIADGGTVSVFAADVGGTTVPFNRQFLDVSSLVVAAEGSTELKAVRQFTDAPNPTSFKVYLFNAAGARVNGTISWHARGVQAVV